MPSPVHVVDMTRIDISTPAEQVVSGSQDNDCFGAIDRAFTNYLGGSSEAFGTVMKLSGPFVRRAVHDCGVPSASVDDVMQMVWCRLINKASSVRDPRAVTAWLTTTARRESLRWLRRHKQESTDARTALSTKGTAAEPSRQVVGSVAVPGAGYWASTPGPTTAGSELLEPARIVELRERNALLREHIDRLPTKCQRILHAVADSARPDYRGLAEQLGIAVGSVGPTRSRCLRQLRESLAADPRWPGFAEKQSP